MGRKLCIILTFSSATSLGNLIEATEPVTPTRTLDIAQPLPANSGFQFFTLVHTFIVKNTL